MEPEKHLRKVRSFVHRESRMTARQKRAMDELWPVFGITPADTALDLKAIFGRDAPRNLEIGLGMGDALLAMAQRYPEQDFVGIDVHRPGVGHALDVGRTLGLTNIRMVITDAVEVLKRSIADASFDAIYIFFPDPWPKTRHHKRRLISPEFVDLLSHKLKPGGVVHLATDWEAYAVWMMEHFSASPAFENVSGVGMFAPRCEDRALTKFEARGQRLGHGVWDLAFSRRP